MSNVETFWEFISKHHPNLANHDWLVESKLLKREDIVNPDVKEYVPLDISELNLFTFYYEGSSKEVVFLLKDKKKDKNIAIGLLKDNVLVNAIQL